MTVSSLGASTSAYSYLQSLLPQQADDGKRTGSSDPVTELLKAFYPNSSADAGTSPDVAGGGGTGTLTFFNHDTMTALMFAQEQPSGDNPFVTARAQSLFSQVDVNADGQVSQSEFENIFGSDADTSKVDGLFNALDGNGDGSVSLDELTSAAQASHAHHHGHHHNGDGGQGIGQTIDALLSGTQGASVDSTSNADGSSTTTISYADGSKVALTTPSGSGDSAGDSTSGSGGTSSGNTNSGNANYASLLEQLIRLQAQVLSASSSQSLSSQTLASV